VRARILVIAAGMLALCVGASAAFADPAPAPQYFNLPAGYNAGMGIAPAPDGSVWFVANFPATHTPAIGRLTTSQASPGTANGMATFPTPTQIGTSCCANAVRSVAFDAAGNRLWFVQNDGIVGYANPAAVSPGTSAGIVDTLLAHPSDLWDVAIGAGGLAWFSEQSAGNVPPYPGDRIASIDVGLHVTEQENIALQGGAVSLDSTRYDAQPEGIATDTTGKPWFAEASPGLPGYRIATTAAGSGYAEYLITPCAPTLPCSGSNTGTGPTDVAVAHDGSIWFTNQLKDEVGRLDPNGHTFTSYSLPAIDAGLAGGQARAISVASDGTLWLAEFGGFSNANANAIVRIVPSQPTPTASTWHLGATGYPLAVAPDTKGNVWFALATPVAPGLIGRLAGVLASSGGGGGGGGGTPLTPARVGVARVGTPSVKGSSVTVDQRCVGPPSDPCSLVYIISTHEYVTGFPGSRASAAKARKKRKPKPVILGQKTVTLHGGQHKRVTITLNARGRRLLKHAGHLRLFFTATEKGPKGKAPKRVKKAKVTFKVKQRR
jgi:streptogramin lyase